MREPRVGGLQLSHRPEVHSPGSQFLKKEKASHADSTVTMLAPTGHLSEPWESQLLYSRWCGFGKRALSTSVSSSVKGKELCLLHRLFRGPGKLVFVLHLTQY